MNFWLKANPKQAISRASLPLKIHVLLIFGTYIFLMPEDLLNRLWVAHLGDQGTSMMRLVLPQGPRSPWLWPSGHVNAPRIPLNLYCMPHPTPPSHQLLPKWTNICSPPLMPSSATLALADSVLWCSFHMTPYIVTMLPSSRTYNIIKFFHFRTPVYGVTFGTRLIIKTHF